MKRETISGVVLAVTLAAGVTGLAVQRVTGTEPHPTPMHTPKILPNNGSEYGCYVDAGGPNCEAVQTSTPTRR